MDGVLGIIGIPIFNEGKGIKAKIRWRVEGVIQRITPFEIYPTSDHLL